jgi:hypothetical protein
MPPRLSICALALLLTTARLQTQPAGKPVPVTPDNFTRAESDMYFADVIKNAGGVGKLRHIREVTPVDRQPVVRPNRDTLYSSGVFDLDEGPVTITMPAAGRRFMSLMAINEDHYVVGEVRYAPGEYTFGKKGVGTRYVMLGMRTLVDSNDSQDVQQAHRLQDAIRIRQTGSGTFTVPTWDQASQKKIREALLQLNETLTDTVRMFGAKSDVDPVRHLIGTAMGWGGNPEKDAFYLPTTPAKNDGSTVHRLVVKEVPVDGFWSITVYNREGYLQANPLKAYSLNNITAVKGSDGSVTVQFGDCDGQSPNCLPIVAGWNYLVRLYRPRREILDGSWKFPQAEAPK